MPVQMTRAARAESGFAAVLTYLAPRAPFTTMPLGGVVDTVSGAVKRGHYTLAVEDGRVVGTVVWALCDNALAWHWMAGRATPTYEESLDGDTVVMMLGGALTTRAAHIGVRHVASLYPGRRYIMNRFGRGERRSAGLFPSAHKP